MRRVPFLWEPSLLCRLLLWLMFLALLLRVRGTLLLGYCRGHALRWGGLMAVLLERRTLLLSLLLLQLRLSWRLRLRPLEGPLTLLCLPLLELLLDSLLLDSLLLAGLASLFLLLDSLLLDSLLLAGLASLFLLGSPLGLMSPASLFG